MNEIAGAVIRVCDLLGGIGIEEAEIAREEHVPRPVERDFNPARPSRKLEEIDTAPHQPGEETRDVHPEHFRNGLVTADGAELPQGFEMERFCGFAIHDSNEVECRLATLAFRELTGRRGRFVIEGVDREGTIANGPRVRLPFNSHIRSRAYASSLFWSIEALHNGGDRGSDRADDSGAQQHASIVEFDSLMRCRNRAGIQQHGDAGSLHLLPCEFAQLCRYFGQDLALGIDQRDNHIIFAEIAVKAGAAANEFIDFSGYFRTAEARSHDDEAEIPAAAIGITRGLGIFHLMDDMLAKINGIAHNLEGKSVFAHSGDDSQIAFRAAGNHDVVVVQACQCAVAIVELNL